MPEPSSLLVVDQNLDNGELLVRTLNRKFPKASVRLCPDGETAVRYLRTEQIDAVILHRTHDMDALSGIKAFREISTELPILVVSTIDRSELFLAAGADGFMKYDEWLRVGTVVGAMIEAKRKEIAAGPRC